VGEVRKIRSGKLHHHPCCFSSEYVRMIISVFSHNIIEGNSLYFFFFILVEKEQGKLLSDVLPLLEVMKDIKINL
jgi:hypothetical protein